MCVSHISYSGMMERFLAADICLFALIFPVNNFLPESSSCSQITDGEFALQFPEKMEISSSSNIYSCALPPVTCQNVDRH